MSKRNTFQSVYRDVEDGRFPSDRTYKPSQHPLRSLLYRPKSQILTVITLFLLTFLLTRGHYAGKVKGLEERIEGMKKGGHGVAGEKQETFAIVTFETRDVTYWRESLGNKYLYAQRHGYVPLFSFFLGPELLSYPCHPFTRIAATVALPVLRVWKNVMLRGPRRLTVATPSILTSRNSLMTTSAEYGPKFLS